MTEWWNQDRQPVKPTDALAKRALKFVQHYVSIYIKHRDQQDYRGAVYYLRRAGKLSQTLLAAMDADRCYIAPLDRQNAYRLIRHAQTLAVI